MIVFHPFLGEFGWELMRWQGLVRAKCMEDSENIVFCMKGREYLYESAAQVVPLCIEGGTPDCWGRDDYTIKPDAFRHNETYAYWTNMVGVKHIAPTRAFCCGNIKQEFIRFGEENYAKRMPMILLHARSDHRKTLYGNRNWPVSEWVKVVDEIQKDGLLGAYSVGTMECAEYIPGTVDFRGIPLKELAQIMSTSKLILGPSSGPMHLASLCGLPHIVWTDARNWNLGSRAGTNRDRYEHVWNPLKTKCWVVDSHGWQPPAEIIIQTIKEVFDEKASGVLDAV